MNHTYGQTTEFQHPTITQTLIHNPMVSIAPGDISRRELIELVYYIQCMKITCMENRIDLPKRIIGLWPERLNRPGHVRICNKTYPHTSTSTGIPVINDWLLSFS